MELPILHRKTRGITLFWSLMVLCIMLTVACIFLAVSQVGQPWGGFAFNVWGQVMKANETDFVFFDPILAAENRPIQSHSHPGTVLREVIRQTPEGTPLTYRVRRGQKEHEVIVPVQVITRKRLAIEFGLPLFVALGQLGMGALVFLLRPNTQRSWVFLGFCWIWFCLFVTIYDFQSTHVFTELFLLSWYLSSAVLVHLAFVFPEERQWIRQHPPRQCLFYLPSLLLWGVSRICNTFFHAPWVSTMNLQITYIHTVYWGAALLFLLASLVYTALRASSPVARNRATTVFCGFAAGFVIPVGGESIALLFHINLGYGEE